MWAERERGKIGGTGVRPRYKAHPPHSATFTPAPWIGIHHEVIEDIHGFILLLNHHKNNTLSTVHFCAKQNIGAPALSYITGEMDQRVVLSYITGEMDQRVASKWKLCATQTERKRVLLRVSGTLFFLGWKKQNVVLCVKTRACGFGQKKKKRKRFNLGCAVLYVSVFPWTHRNVGGILSFQK